MGVYTDRLREVGRQSSVPSEDGAGVGQIPEREQAIIDRHKQELPDSQFAQRVARAKAAREIKFRQQQRAYAEQAPPEMADPVREMLSNLGNRSKVLGILRQMTPEQRAEALRLAPGISQQLGDDRGGAVGRTLGAISRGISHGVSQPVAELLGLGGTNEEIEYIRQLDAAASQEFSPARPGDPWYERGPLQAAEMAPWMATVAGGAGLGRAAATGVAGRLAAGAAGGSRTAGMAVRAGQAIGGLPARAGLPALTAGTAGELAGVTAAAFPSQYAQEVDQLKELGMEDGRKLRLLAAGTAAITGLVEGIVPNPFKTGEVPLTQGAIKAARQYLWEAAKKAPGEMSEEYIQGVTSGLGAHVAQYLDENVEDKSVADAFKNGWEQAKEAALPMAFLLGVPAAGGAGLSAARAQRLSRLQEIRSKGFVSTEDAQQVGIEGKNRKERLANVDAEIKSLETEANRGGEVPPPIPGQQPATQGVPNEVQQGSQQGQQTKPGQAQAPAGQVDEEIGVVQTPEEIAAELEARRAQRKAAQSQPSRDDLTKVGDAGGAIVDNFYEGIRKSLNETGQVPAPERKSSVGQAWNAWQDKADIDGFVNSLRKSAQPATGETGDFVTKAYMEAVAAGEYGPIYSKSKEKIDEDVAYYRDIFTDSLKKNKDAHTPFVGQGSKRQAFFDALAKEAGGTLEWTDIGGGQFTGKFVKNAAGGADATQVRPDERRPEAKGNVGEGSQVAGGGQVRVEGQDQSGEKQKGKKPAAPEVPIKTAPAPQQPGGGDPATTTAGQVPPKTQQPAQKSPAKLGDRVFVPERTQQGGKTLPATVGKVISGAPGADSVTVELDGGGREKVKKSDLLLPDATFEAGEQVRVPWVKGKDDAAATVQKVLPDGKYEVTFASGRSAVQSGDQLIKLQDQPTTGGEPQPEAPEVRSIEDIESLPKYTVYQVPKAKGRFRVRSEGSRGGGDVIFDTYEDAVKYAETEKTREQQRAEAKAKREEREAEEAKKEADYVASFQGFRADSPMAFGRARKTLEVQRNYRNKVQTRKQIVEQAVADGAVVKDGRLEYPDGAFLDAGEITKIGIDYAEHLIAQRKESVSSESLPIKPGSLAARVLNAATEDSGEGVQFIPGKGYPVSVQYEGESINARVTAYDQGRGTFTIKHPKGFFVDGYSPDDLSAPVSPEDALKAENKSYRQGIENAAGINQGGREALKDLASKPRSDKEIGQFISDHLDFQGGTADVTVRNKTVEFRSGQKLKGKQLVDTIRSLFGIDVPPPKKKGRKEPFNPKTFEDLQKLTFNDVLEGEETEGVGKNKGVTYRSYTYEVADEDGKQRKYNVKINDRENKPKIDRGDLTREQREKDQLDEYESLKPETKQRIVEIGMDDMLTNYQKYDVGLFIEGRTDGHRGTERTVKIVLGGNVKPRVLADKMGRPDDNTLTWDDILEFVRKPANAGTETETDLEAMIEAEFDAQLGIEKPAKKRSARKQSSAKLPKKTGRKTQEPSATTSPSSKLKNAADRARAEADNLWAELNNLAKDKLTSGLDPDLARLAVRVALAEIKAGTLSFAAFVESTIAKVPADMLDKMKPYMEMSWKVAHKRGMTDDPGGKFDDVLAKTTSEQSNVATNENAGAEDQAAGTEDRRDGTDTTGTADAGVLAGESPADGETLDGPGDTGGVRNRPGGEVRPGSGEADSGGVDGSSRRGTDSRGTSTDDTGERGSGNDRAPTATRPNYHLTDPDAIIGGGPKAKFERNRKAIEIVRELEAENRDPTSEELDILAGYTGWGAFGQQLFDGTWDRPKVKEGWEEQDEWLRIYLGEEDWKSAQQSIVNAHYTDPQTVTAIWDALRRMGFKGGRVLEPSMGIGNFFSLMPRDLMSKSTLTGIELDKMTASIAKYLHPQANIQQKGYQESNTPDNFYDVIVSNVPFGNYQIADRRYKQDFSIHNYFFKKAFDQLKPGGVIAFITSNATMDGKTQARLMRAQIANDGDLISAIRLPSGAFQAYAGTKVVADLIVIRKRKPGEEASSQEWIDVVDYETPNGNTITVNEYWTTHPENILGTMTHGHGTTSGRPGMIVEQPSDLQAAIDSAVQSLPEGIINTERAASEGREKANTTQMRQNSVITQDGDLWIVKGEQLLPLYEFTKWHTAKSKPSTIKKNREEIESLLGVREALRTVLDQQAASEDAADSRGELNRVYDAFVAKYGPIGTSKSAKHLRKAGDPMANTLLALEAKRDGKYHKRPIFDRPTVRQRKKIENPTINDAFAMARNRSLDLNMEEIAKTANVSVEQVIQQLESENKIYKTGLGTYDAADVFLSGNMARKLRQLQAAQAEGIDGLEKSIQAVRDRIPEPVPYSQIDAKLGATWIEAGDYADFLGFLLNEPATAFQVDRRISGWKTRIPTDIGNKTEAQNTHGHPGIAFSKLMDAAMNNGTVKLTMPDPENPGSRIADPVATAEANTKIGELREKFSNWIWTSPDRISRLSSVYNEEFNSTVTPEFDDVPLQFEGLALERGEQPFNLRSHQESAIWRGIVSGKGIFAHEVGTGKTLTMAGLAMESRRLGLASKPLLLAHNANSQAVRNEIQEAYPNANILYVDNLDANRKAETLQAIATEDWDLIIVPHSMAEGFQLRPETVERLLQAEMDALEAAALEAFEESEATDFAKGTMPSNLNDISEEELRKLKEPTAKELVKERLKLRKMIDKAAQAMQKGTGITFEDMGVDMVMVDEAHIFKKLPITTKQNIKGLNKTASKRGTMMMMLADYVRGINNGRGVYMFTGTPITNTINEVFNMMRFVMAEEMEAAGVRNWDGWFNTFATQETLTELSSGGTWENFDRLSSFVNLPELRQMVGQYMDIVFADEMPEFTLRDTREGRTENPVGRPYKQIHNKTVEMTDAQRVHSEDLKHRYTTFKNATGREKVSMMREPGGRYNPLVIEGEGVKLAMDPRLVGFGVKASEEGPLTTDEAEMDPRDPSLKINQMIHNAMAHYHEHPKATQMIFMQIGHNDWTERTIGRNRDGKPIKERVRVFNLAKEIKRRLMEEGVPESEIALFSVMSKEKRTETAQAMREGKVRFAIGSTETMGTGVNAQDEMVAMHHLDAPWMPGDLEQRNGRGHRQGNKWNTVHEYRYLTEGPQDGRRWQVLLTKSRFIEKFMKSDGTERTIEMDDVDMSDTGEGNDMEQTFSAAAGDPRIQMRIRLEGQVAKLERARDNHARTITDTASRANQKLKQIESSRETINKLQSDYDTWSSNKPEDGKPSITIRDRVITGQKEVDDELAALGERYRNTIGQKFQLGEYRGIPVFNNNGVLYLGESNLQARWNLTSLQQLMANIPVRIAKIEKGIEKDERFIKMAHDAVGQPFPKQKQLDTKRKKLETIVAEMQANPEPSPAWLRAGAPVGTSVFLPKTVRVRSSGMQAFWDMESELFRESITGETVSPAITEEVRRVEYEVAGHRGDSEVLYSEGNELKPLPAKDLTDKDGTPVFPELQKATPGEQKLSDDLDALGQLESDDVVAKARSQAIDIALDAEDAGIKTFDELVAFSVKKLGEQRTRAIGGYLYQAGKAAEMPGLRPTRDVLGMPGVTREQAAALAKAAFPMLTDEQIESGIELQDITGFGRDEVGFAPAGTPPPGTLLNRLQKDANDNVKGWTQFISATRAIIGATSKADVSTFIHEFFHPMRRFLLDRNIPQEQRAGITDKDIQALEAYVGVKDGDWKFGHIKDRKQRLKAVVQAEEKAAKAWEQYWFEGKSPNSALNALFEKLARWMRNVYKGIQEITGGQLPQEVRDLFDKIVQRGLPEGKQMDEPPTKPPAQGSLEEPADNPLTSIKNEVVNELRARRGVPELDDVASQTQQEWLDRAEVMLSQDPLLGSRIVREINTKPRNLSNAEVAVMQIYYRQVNNQLEAASQKLFEAKNRGDELESARALTDTELIMNALSEIEDATKAAGREWGRAGVARQIVLERDFSLAALMRKARVANAGNPLNAEQQAEMAELAKRVAELEGQLAKAEQEKRDLERQKSIDQGIEDDKKKVKKTVRKSAARQKAIEAVSAFKKKFAGIFTPKQSDDALGQTEEERMAEEAGSVVLAYVEAGVSSFGEFMANVRRDLGNDMPVQARVAFATAWENFKAVGEIPTPEIDKDDLRGMTRLARRIQRALVESGITERDEVVDAVHESLQEIEPGITRREAMDALSGYGQYTLLPDGEIEKIIRDINGQLQQLAKLEDMRAGQAPAKTGGERRTPSDEERRLIQEVNEAKRRGGFLVTDPETQLRTALDAAKRATRNRISDLEYEIKARERIVRTKTELEPDAELESLRKRRDALLEVHRKLFPKPGATMAQRIAAANRAVDKAIADIEEQLRTGDVSPKKGPKTPVTTPELEAKRARLEALREQRDAIRALQNPKMTPEQRAERAYKANLLKKIADYQDRMIKSDFDPRPRKEPRVLSSEELSLKRQLEEVKDQFYRKAADYRLANMSPKERAWDFTKETAHLSRALMTSIDLSAVFRQGGVAAFSHPKLAAETSKEMLEALVSKQSEFDTAEKIRNDPMYQFAMTVGLSITEEEGKITRQEEAYMGRWARHGFGKEGSLLNKVSKLALSPVSASARAYTTFLNGMRFRLFKHMVGNLKGGQVTEDEGKVIAMYVNAATGRADLGKYNQAAANLNMVFFAPRYVASRFQYLAMPFYLVDNKKVTGRVRKAIAIEYMRYAASMGSFLGLTVALGSLLTDDDEEKPVVELDPRSSDFLKIKIGETRIDPMSGLAQTIVLSSRVLSGQRKTLGGKLIDLRGENVPYGSGGTAGVIGDFLRTKLAPVPGATLDILHGENVIGEPETPVSAAMDLFVPLSLQEIKETMQAQGIPAGTAISMLALLGMGGGTYGSKSQYMTGTEAEREEQFSKDLKRMEWDSPDLPYSEFLTQEQMEQVQARREERKQALVYVASGTPDRRDYLSSESYEKAIAERDAALDALKNAGFTRSEIRQLLLDYWTSRYKSPREIRSGYPVLKDAVKERLRQINREFGGN